MIKLTKILSELQIADPNITLKKVQLYLKNNIWDNHPNKLWFEYEKLCQPYLKKYHSDFYLTIGELEQLSKPDLIKIYKEMRALVRKHVGTEILSELQVAPQGITAEKVKQYFNDNLTSNDVEFGAYSQGWLEYWTIKKQYLEKYNLEIDGTFTSTLIKQLSKPDLIQFYNEMRALVRKYVGKEILNELQITNPVITAEKVAKYYMDNIFKNTFDNEGWNEYEQICKPYLKKYHISNAFFFHFLRDFQKLSKPELTKMYNKMQVLVKKYS